MQRALVYVRRKIKNARISWLKIRVNIIISQNHIRRAEGYFLNRCVRQNPILGLRASLSNSLCQWVCPRLPFQQSHRQGFSPNPKCRIFVPYSRLCNESLHPAHFRKKYNACVFYPMFSPRSENIFAIYLSAKNSETLEKKLLRC